MAPPDRYQGHWIYRGDSAEELLVKFEKLIRSDIGRQDYLEIRGEILWRLQCLEPVKEWQPVEMPDFVADLLNTKKGKY